MFQSNILEKEGNPMNKRSWYAALVVMAIVVAVLVFFIKISANNRSWAELAAIFQKNIEVVSDFHSDIDTLQPSLSQLGLLRNEMTKMKNWANKADEKLDTLNARAYATDGTEANAVKEVIEKSKKYLRCYVDQSGLKVSRQNIELAADEMLRSIDRAKSILDITGSPDSADVGKALDVTTKLASNFQKAGRSLAVGSGIKLVRTSYPTWVSSSEQRGAFDSVRQIAQDIVQTRRYLGSKAGINWSYGKQGYWDYFENPRFQQIFRTIREEKMRKLDELAAIENVEGMSELSGILRQMLQNSVNAMGALIGDANYSLFSQYNIDNNRLSEQLKRQYGIVAR